MPRKRRLPVETANHDRWLISYADFITLLFAFFVVMFASSATNKDKARRVSQAVESALSGGLGTRTPQKKEPPPAETGANELFSSLQLLQKRLAAEVGSGQIKLTLQERGLVVTLSEAGFFHPGDDKIQSASYSAFEKLADALHKIPNPVRLEGHTDAVPIHNPRFRSNWDLSTSRALAVLTLLEETYAIDRRRLSAAGYADTAPVETNATESGRARNRRVDLVILSNSGMAGQPASGATPGG